MKRKNLIYAKRGTGEVFVVWPDAGPALNAVLDVLRTGPHHERRGTNDLEAEEERSRESLPFGSGGVGLERPGGDGGFDCLFDSERQRMDASRFDIPVAADDDFHTDTAGDSRLCRDLGVFGDDARADGAGIFKRALRRDPRARDWRHRCFQDHQR